MLFMESIRQKGYPVNIMVKVSQPGYHRWLEAPERLAFLRNYHRHLFIIEASIHIQKDREIEFFELQGKIRGLINSYIERQEAETKSFDWDEFEELTGEKDNVLVINSCEDFATWLVTQLEFMYGAEASIMVGVSEDNENKSVVSNY